MEKPKIDNQQIGLSSVLNDQKIKEWCTQFPEFQKLKAADRAHVVSCLRSIVHWYDTGIDTYGHFLTAIIKNDFMQAVTRADSVNLSCLEVYAKFLYNLMPMDYKIKALKL